MKAKDGISEHREMMREHQGKMLWTYYTNIALGAWLIAGPLSFEYGSKGLAWSDALSGAAVLALGCLSLAPRFDNWRWGICAAGIWLLFAPLVFWSPTPLVYVQDTLVGALLIAFSILIPGMPGMGMMMTMMEPGPDIPSGWTYNPSSWPQRGISIGLAIAGFLISRYLAAFQLGYINHAWDPFFGESTKKVLTSEVSRMWPISDAGLGALAYTLEALSGYMGDQRRWRTMPWMVLMFGILVIPLGLTHIVLVVLQPVAVGAWCTLCLAAASLMLLMIPLAVDEVVAMGQFLRKAHQDGKPFWRTFWLGGTLEGGGPDERTPRFGKPAASVVRSMFWGVSTPWTLLASAALGLWLMFAPALFGSRSGAADSDHLLGALVVTVSVICMAEVIRAGRFLNILLGLGISVAPFALGGSTDVSRWNDVGVGIVLVVLSLPRGLVREHYGRWDRLIKLRTRPPKAARA